MVFINIKICGRYAESGNYEDFVLVYCCQLQFVQAQILTNKHDRVTIITTSGSNYQLLVAAPQKITPGSVLLGIKQMPWILT